MILPDHKKPKLAKNLSKRCVNAMPTEFDMCHLLRGCCPGLGRGRAPLQHVLPIISQPQGAGQFQGRFPVQLLNGFQVHIRPHLLPRVVCCFLGLT
jgi:hypothetical protein